MTEETTMLGNGRRVMGPATEKRMFSLMEVAQETGIAMPILLRYKREHPERIPSVGSGAQQRFPEEAFAIFAEIREEESQERDLPRSGGFGLLSLPRFRRTRKEPREESPAVPQEEPSAGAEEAPAQAAPTTEPLAPEPTPEPVTHAGPAPSSTGETTLTLKDISAQLGIAYPTVARYAAKFPDRIPYEGDGRQRRFPPEALEVFEQIRKESKPGRPPKSKSAKAARTQPTMDRGVVPRAPRPMVQAAPASDGRLLRRIERLEREHQQLEALVRSLREELQRPLRATINPD